MYKIAKSELAARSTPASAFTGWGGRSSPRIGCDRRKWVGLTLAQRARRTQCGDRTHLRPLGRRRTGPSAGPRHGGRLGAGLLRPAWAEPALTGGVDLHIC